MLLATLFFEFTSRAEAHAVLADVADFDEHTFLRVGPHRLPVRYVRSPGEPRLTAVNYLHIPVPDAQRQLLTQNSVPVAFEITHPAYMQAAILPAIHVPRDCRRSRAALRASVLGSGSADARLSTIDYARVARRYLRVHATAGSPGASAGAGRGMP